MILLNQGVRPRDYSQHTSRQRGFTLIELMMSVVLLAIGAALAIPSYRDMVEKRQLTNAAEQITAFINATQGISTRTNQIVTVSYTRNGDDDWCIGAAMGDTACDCEEDDPAATNFCQIDSQAYVVNQSVSNGSNLMHNIGGSDSYSFDPIRGIFTDMADSLTLEMRSPSGDFRLNLEVVPSGKVILCSDDSSHAIPGYEVC